MITEPRRPHIIEKTPYRRAVESARWCAVGGAHHWHRPVKAGHGRRPVAVVRRVVPGRPVGRQGLGVV